ncbi:MAG: type II toxin-antitoxin system mRNA interferase toxin, RelE/StbE family [Coriobacteriaceae bacterium]|nr:type II toxin-antitoxin system mRNA interferase toxin, RelE/StbE family [Coriobacteriaceae bacterium]
MPHYELEFRPSAYRQFAKLDAAIKRRVSPAIEALRVDPRPVGAKHLCGPDDAWRIRVGAYRIVYTIQDDRLLVLVLKLGHRRNVYRGT